MWRRILCTHLNNSTHISKACIHILNKMNNNTRIIRVSDKLRPLRERKSFVKLTNFDDVEENESSMENKNLFSPNSSSEPISGSSYFKKSLITSWQKKNQINKNKNKLRKEIKDEEITPHDPATVVKLDSNKKQLYLSPIQRELIWSERKREYQELLIRIVSCLESHLSPIEKCYTLLDLHEEVITKRIRIRSDTYEDIFHTFYAVSTLGSTTPALVEEEIMDRTLTSSSSLLPDEFSTINIAAASFLAAPLLQTLWSIYRYMIDSGTNPTSRIIQYMMGILERYHNNNNNNKKDAIVEARAHSLMMDLDRFHLTPSEYTINSYIGICDCNNVMHLALARVTDYRTRHERQASAGMFARLLFGFIHNKQYKEALACLTTIDSVAITPYLMNAILNTARHSRDPISTFTFYKSIMGRKHGGGVAPSVHTISILLESMRAVNCYEEFDFLLREMRRYRIKGNSMILNRILEIFLKLKRYKEAVTLQNTMKRKGIVVFDELQRECYKTHEMISS